MGKISDAKAATHSLYWKNIVECVYDEERDERRVVYEASPSLIAPYYKYEVILDAQRGIIKSSRRLE